MIAYELYIAGQRADIDENLSVQITKAIDDVSSFATRNTSFSKVIVLPGTARNNGILGHVYELGSNNPYTPGGANIGSAFNVAQTSRCELRINGLLILRGVFRLTNIVRTRDRIEYEGAIFGELGGFIATIGNQKLEDLDFSAYDHTYNTANITASWDNTPGSGYFYPLIDYGTWSTNKVDYDIRTFRPSLYAKEYIDKIFAAAGYTYDSAFLDSAYFKSLIIPHNTKRLEKITDVLLTAELSGGVISFSGANILLEYDTAVGGDFIINLANSIFEYNDPTAINVSISVDLRFFYTSDDFFDFAITINGDVVDSITLPAASNAEALFTLSYQGLLSNADQIRVALQNDLRSTIDITGIESTLLVTTAIPTVTNVDVNDTVQVNYTIPRGIFQKDFFASILKMFNLYVVEDPIVDKKLLIKPFVDFYNLTTYVDWSRKVARDKAWQIVPMGNLNGRFFEFKFKGDNDFYNEQYQKKYQQGYGDRLLDTGFQFSKDKVTSEVIFSATPLVQYTGTDKILGAIYKKSKGNSVDQEELTESNIRILFSKKVTGVASWKIKDGVTDLATITNYGFAGHLNDPAAPTQDLNFGAVSEIYTDSITYPSANVVNEYWSDYIAEVADKDSKLLKCYVYLTPLDFTNLDFAVPVFIDGVLFRINKVEDYDGTKNELAKVELLKIIDTNG